MAASTTEPQTHPRRGSLARLRAAAALTLALLLAPACSQSCNDPSPPAASRAPASPRLEHAEDPSGLPASPIPQSATMPRSAIRRLGAGPASEPLVAIQPSERIMTPRVAGIPAAPEPSTPAGAAPASEPTAGAPGAAATGFLEQPETELLERLRSGHVESIKKGTGGRTLAFKVTLSNGTVGYFKPEQRVSSAHWYAEVAAYYLDRALGFGRVPTLVSRRLPWSPFASAAAEDPRSAEIILGQDGTVRGALIAWLPDPLVPAATPPGWENWVRSAPFPPAAVTPYQRAARYFAARNEQLRRSKHGEPGVMRYRVAPEPSDASLPAALSDMIVFDFLTLNYDRFGGDNVNVLTLGERGPLIWLDNGDAFSVGPPRRSLLDARLEPLSRFRTRTVQALRALDVNALGERMRADPLGPILTPSMLRGLELRRQAVLQHVAAQERRYGEAVYAW